MNTSEMSCFILKVTSYFRIVYIFLAIRVDNIDRRLVSVSITVENSGFKKMGVGEKNQFVLKPIFIHKNIDLKMNDESSFQIYILCLFTNALLSPLE